MQSFSTPRGMNPHEPQMGFLGSYLHNNRRVNFPVKLEKVNCEVEIRGFVANIVSRLTFTNSSSNTLQVNFKCPVDEEAAIYKFEAEIDGRTIIAHCLEKKKATKIYEDAVRDGNTAVLGQEDVRSADVFMIDLGNLRQGKVAELRLSMVMELKVCAGGSLSFVMPTILNPRYDPGTSHQNQNSPFVNIPTASITVPEQYLLQVTAKIIGSHAIARVESPTDSNNITVNMAPDRMSANVDQVRGFKCDHDWSLLIYYDNPYKMHVLREAGDRSAVGHMKDHIVMINVFPELPSSSYSNRNEIIFVVDCSGSMSGGCIGSAREALLLFLKSLPPGCLFNIVCFGNSYRKLFSEGSREYNEATLGAACALQGSMGADMGGTEILRPLENIFSQPTVTGFARQVIVLTDGEVWNVKQVTDLIGRNSHNSRLFSVGIGSGASSALVKGMARAGRGRYEMVQDHTNLQAKVMSLMQAMVQESVQEVTVACIVEPASRVALVPPAPPIIFGGNHLVLYARILPTTEVLSVTIKGRVGAEECTVTINGSEITQIHDENRSLHCLAARAQIIAWEADDEESNKESIIRLSEASGVVSRWTALVGVDQDGKKSYYGSEEAQYNSGMGVAFAAAASGPCFADSASGPVSSNHRFGSASASAPLYSAAASAPAFGSSVNFDSGFGSRSMQSNSMQSNSMRSAFAGNMFGAVADSGISKAAGFGSNSIPGNLFGGVVQGGMFGQTTGSMPMGCGSMPTAITESSNTLKSTTSSNEGLMALVQSQQFNGSWKLESVASFMKVSVDSLHQNCPIQRLDSDIQYESVRLKTFAKWPLNFINPVELAVCGFVYINSSDHCVCAFCNGGVNNWEEGDTPSGEHKKHFPQCPFVLGQNVGNVSTSEEGKIPYSPTVESAWATCLALRLLETRFSGQRQEWQLIAMKAQTYLDTTKTAFMVESAKAII